MPEGNPLVAQAQSTTTGYTGIGIAESAVDLASGISDGSWVAVGLGAVGVGLEVLSMVVDPIGTLASYGVSWLIEHVQPLKEALDWLAGDPPVIQSFSETWANVAAEVSAVAGDLGNEVNTGTAGWSGEAADAYRQASAEQADAIAGAATLSEGISVGVMIMGEVVAAVREIVRDLVGELVGKLITWALEAAGTLGFATPLIAVQATAAISKAINKIADLIRNLVKTISNVSPLIRRVIDKLDEIIQALAKLARKFSPGGGTTPSSTPNTPGIDAPTVKSPDTTTPSSATTTPSGTTTPDAPSTTPKSPDTTSPSSTSPDGPGTTPNGGKPDGTSPNGNKPDGSNRPSDPNDTKTPETSRTTCNDPVDVTTGEVVLGQTDVELAGVLPLILKRTHVSSYRAGRSFGPSWASTLDQRLEFDDQGVVYVAEDGMLLVYPRPHTNREVLPEVGPRWPLYRTETGYAVHQCQTGRTLHFEDASASTMPMTAVTDRSGNRIDFGRDDDQVVTEVRHSGGYHIVVGSNDQKITELWLRGSDGADISLIRFGYTDTGLLAEVVNSSNRALKFDYDHSGRIAQWTDRNGEWYRYFYGSDGRCVANQGSGGFLNGTFAYDADSRITRFTDALGNTTVYEFDSRNNVVAETNPLGHTTGFAWDADDRLLSRTDALGHITRYEYDDQGNLVVLTRPDGSQARAEFNELGRPIVTIDPDGAVWKRSYDSAGRVTTIIDPAGSRTLCTYNQVGQLVSVTDPLGRVHRTETNAAGLPIAEIDVHGNVTRYRRDQFGRISQVIDSTGATVHLNWTVEGKILSRTAPDGAVEKWRYDGEGNAVEHCDPLGRITTVRTTHFDLPAEELHPDGSRLKFEYDSLLRLTSVTNSQGLAWRYSYNSAGNLVSETDFNGRRLEYEHDPSGALVGRVNGAGQEVRFVRDELGNIVKRSHGDVVELFEFDPAGRLVAAKNANGELVLTRDRLGRVLSEGVDGKNVTSEYDLIGRRTRRRTPSGSETSWRYQTGGRPVELATAGRVMTFGYNSVGHETERLLDTGTIIAQAWDINHRLSTQTVSTVARRQPGPIEGTHAQLIQKRDYRYLADGHLAGVDDQLGGSISYEMDSVARITAAHGSGWTESYAYDTAGNVTAASWPGGRQEAQGTRDYSGSLITRAGNVRYRYDAQGRVVHRQKKRLSAKPDNWHYSWDADDRLVALVTPDGTRWRYLYDPLGRRIAKLRTEGVTGAVVERVDFSWDGMVLAEQRHSSGHATTWNWEPGSFRPVCQVERARSGDTGQDWVDREFFSIVTDIIGTPTELVDPAGKVTWKRNATIWGHLLDQSRQSASTPLRFPGQYFDFESQLNYNYYRYYDAETGRYASPDPLGLAPTMNPQSYVPNPTASTDPSGLSPCRNFYSVQNRADADRLINNGGEPWPSGIDGNNRPRSEMGEGLYAWESREQAERYLDMIRSREGAPTDLEIVQHRISGDDFDSLRSADMTTMDDDAATELWNAGGNHDYDHIRRMTGRFGAESYFSSGVYNLFQSWRLS
ncbi:DUF6531 domain-containing protein [Amycolatopsis palatopharyngis]|uniref:DUF6531 domain-containing protein n=1 Tax=Amycolatopsis palatopharyngis TaxID=187982 RepID=UPI0013BEA4E9|nr:DUF6531 domain-containing protein [Amycolatopsis palatopharyngis]